MTPEDWHLYQTYRKSAILWRPWRDRFPDWKGPYVDAVSEIRGYRVRMKSKFETIRGVLGRVSATASMIFREGKPRTTFNVTAGQKPSVKMIRKGHYNIVVTPLWVRNVHPLYQDGYDYGDLILKAERVRVNVKHVELYECWFFNFHSKEVMRSYLAVKTLGKKSFHIGSTAVSAVRAATNAAMKEATNNLIGENK